jgi:hypothetical protein
MENLRKDESGSPAQKRGAKDGTPQKVQNLTTAVEDTILRSKMVEKLDKLPSEEAITAIQSLLDKLESEAGSLFDDPSEANCMVRRMIAAVNNFPERSINRTDFLLMDTSAFLILARMDACMHKVKEPSRPRKELPLLLESLDALRTALSAKHKPGRA